MKFSPAGLLEHARSDEGRKQLRYAGVSVVFVPLGQLFVQLFLRFTDWEAALSVLVTACLLTIPNYFANKILVWRDITKDRLRTQITVFWVAAMLGTGFAMALTTLAEQLTKSNSELTQAIWIFFAQLAGYGIVWVARYLVLDKWIFKATHHGEDPPQDLLDELHQDFPV